MRTVRIGLLLVTVVSVVAHTADSQTALATKTPAQRSENSSQIVATVGGDPITRDELEKVAAKRLFRLAAEEYNVRRAALQEIINDRLMSLAAARENLAVEDFLKREVDTKITLPTDEEVRLVYDGARQQFGSVPEEVALAQIRTSLATRRTGQRKAELLQELYRASHVDIALQPPRLTVSVGNSPAIGPTTAKVTIVEFSDFECPFCARAATTVRTVLAKYPNDVRLVYRHFPLPMHRNALNAAKAAVCAAKEAKFWQMHDLLFSNQSKLSPEDLRTSARNAGLDLTLFDSCFKSSDTEATIGADHDAGDSYGIVGTPAFFINGRLVNGNAALTTFTSIIDEELQNGARRSLKTVSFDADASVWSAAN